MVQYQQHVLFLDLLTRRKSQLATCCEVLNWTKEWELLVYCSPIREYPVVHDGGGTEKMLHSFTYLNFQLLIIDGNDDDDDYIHGCMVWYGMVWYLVPYQYCYYSIELIISTIMIIIPYLANRHMICLRIYHQLDRRSWVVLYRFFRYHNLSY